VERRVFAGGCFFTAASFEFDSRSGPVRDSIANAMRTWLGVLSDAVARAQKCGHLKRSVHPEQFAFEMYSLAIGSHWGHGLFGDRKAFSNARSMILSRLQALATPKSPPIASPDPERSTQRTRKKR
jgi:hypothetical protein